MLEVERLAVSYGEVAALRDVSLTINKAEIITLIRWKRRRQDDDLEDHLRPSGPHYWRHPLRGAVNRQSLDQIVAL